MASIDGIRKIADMGVEYQAAVDIAAEMSDGRIAQVNGIDALRKQGEGMQKIQALGIVVKAQNCLDFPAPKSKPAAESIINDCPIQRGMVLSQLA